MHACVVTCTAVPMREVLMKVNMWLRPRLAVPISQPCAPSNSTWHVGLPWQPILSSMRPMRVVFHSPASPASSGRFLGTRNSEMPLVPAGAPGRRARTQWTCVRTDLDGDGRLSSSDRFRGVVLFQAERRAVGICW